jgi:hypothetical protein
MPQAQKLFTPSPIPLMNSKLMFARSCVRRGRNLAFPLCLIESLLLAQAGAFGVGVRGTPSEVVVGMSARRGSTAALVLLSALLLEAVTAFYLPGVAPKSYRAKDGVSGGSSFAREGPGGE